MKRKIGFTVGVAALLGLGAWWLRSPAAPPEPPRAQHAPAQSKNVQPRTPERSPVHPSTELSPPPPVAAEPVAATPNAEQPAEQAKPKTKHDPAAPFQLHPLTVEGLPERELERHALLERFEKEDRDASWSREARDKVARALSEAHQSASALGELDCRQTICRFLLESSGATTGEVDGLISAARAAAEETWVLPAKATQGTWGIEVFFSREGYRLSGGGGRIDEPAKVEEAPTL